MTEGQIYFQLQEPVRNEAVTVGTSSSVIAEARNEANPRKMILIRNTSSAANMIITVHLGQGLAVSDNGIVLRQYESFTDGSETGYQCHQGVITAISAIAASQLSITER